jgi:hypothetical protein
MVYTDLSPSPGFHSRFGFQEGASVSNIQVNIGGVVGAIGGGLAASALLFTSLDPEKVGELLVFGVVVGAVGGNLLWGAIFKKPVQGAGTSVPQQPNRDSSA